MTLIPVLDNPGVAQLGHDIDDLIGRLKQPVCIKISGNDNSRCRFFVTLLHGNEPSGTKALLHLLRQDVQPAVDIYCYLLAVEAAQLKPLFSNRFVPGKLDYNRCFGRTLELTEQHQVCRQLLQDIRDRQPEAVIDMHNTSGEGPSFAVTRHYNKRIDTLVSLFTDRLMVTGLQLGSLMEHSSEDIPVVTIECGGAYEASSDKIALEGLERFFTSEDVCTPLPHDWGLDILHDPVRLKLLKKEAELRYAEQQCPSATLTLKVDIEHHNFRITEEGTLLGWCEADIASWLQAHDAEGNNRFSDFYCLRDGGLYTACRQKMFMITSIAGIALSDCLWYAVRA